MFDPIPYALPFLPVWAYIQLKLTHLIIYLFIYFEDSFLCWCHPGVLKEYERLWCSDLWWCRTFCVQLCVLSFRPLCRRERSQIPFCTCPSVFKDQWRNTDAVHGIPFGGHCIILLIVFIIHIYYNRICFLLFVCCWTVLL